jgi:hypothetical protein
VNVTIMVFMAGNDITADDIVVYAAVAADEVGEVLYVDLNEQVVTDWALMEGHNILDVDDVYYTLEGIWYMR